MRVAVPRAKFLYTVVFASCMLAYVGWLVFSAVRHKSVPDVGPKLLADATVLGIFVVVACGALLRGLRSYPLTYRGGVYRVRRQRIAPGTALLVGPIRNVAGRRLSFGFSIYLEDFGSFRVRLRRAKRSARVAILREADLSLVKEETFVVHERDYNGGEGGSDNANEVETDLPLEEQTCYLLVQPREGDKTMRVRGWITICLKLKAFLHAPHLDHFQDCRIQVL